MEIDVLMVDDDQACIDSLTHYLQSYSFINIVGQLNNAEDAIVYLRKNKVDLLFLDIEMDGINGLELANHVSSTYPNMLIIFVTGHPGFALQSFEVHPVDYLTKPINFLRLEKAIEKVKDLRTPKAKNLDQKIGIKVSGGIRLIKVHDIMFLEKKGRKVFISSEGEEPFPCTDSMQNLEQIFAHYDFFRSHQSFLINIHKIKTIAPDTYMRSYTIGLMGNESQLPLSRNKYQELKDLLEHKGINIY